MKPILFSWGPLTVYSYGLALAAAFLLFMAYLRRAGRSAGLDPEALTNMAFLALVGGILGGRVLYVVQDWGYFAGHPVEIFLLNRGGLIWYGGFAGGALAAFWYVRRRGWSAPEVLDICAPPVALGQAVGRIGCFLSGCCYGFEAHSPLSVCYPNDLGCRFPVQLLDAALLFALFLFLHRASRTARRAGDVLCYYGMGCGILRFITEFFRGDQTDLALGFTMAQWISAVMALVAAVVFFVRRGRNEKKA